MKQRDGGWSPYLAGALSGVVGVLSVWFAGQFLGASTSFVRTAGMIEQLFGPERVAQMAYFVKTVPKIDWQWMFMVGILLGSAIAAVTSGAFKLQAVPDMWAARFGRGSTARRALVAFVGGVVAMFGARLADG
ncbi:MAG: YeeE/YedE family protein [Desulfobacteraceae bacterium]|nr:YeeE/YedE family protein [Desulfobacteraceae bacterium]